MTPHANNLIRHRFKTERGTEKRKTSEKATVDAGRKVNEMG